MTRTQPELCSHRPWPRTRSPGWTWTRCATETAFPRFEIMTYESLINIHYLLSHLLTPNFNYCKICDYQISSINDNHSDGPLIL
jgi:hypothetical protein